MPTLNVRSVGMSYIIEGLDKDTIDVSALSANIKEIYGIAAATLTVPNRADPTLEEEPVTIDAILIDHRAASWDEIRDWLEAWIMKAGATYASWSASYLGEDVSAVLHYHR